MYLIFKLREKSCNYCSTLLCFMVQSFYKITQLFTTAFPDFVHGLISSNEINIPVYNFNRFLKKIHRVF